MSLLFNSLNFVFLIPLLLFGLFLFFFIFSVFLNFSLRIYVVCNKKTLIYAVDRNGSRRRDKDKSRDKRDKKRRIKDKDRRYKERNLNMINKRKRRRSPNRSSISSHRTDENSNNDNDNNNNNDHNNNHNNNEELRRKRRKLNGDKREIVNNNDHNNVTFNPSMNNAVKDIKSLVSNSKKNTSNIDMIPAVLKDKNNKHKNGSNIPQKTSVDGTNGKTKSLVKKKKKSFLLSLLTLTCSLSL